VNVAILYCVPSTPCCHLYSIVCVYNNQFILGKKKYFLSAKPGWWELGLELGGFLQQREFSVYILVYAWANERGGRRLLYWLWAAAINPGMGCVWAVMVIGNWLQQEGVDAATPMRRVAAAARACWRRSWLVRWLGCPAEEETNGEEREGGFEMVSIGLHSQTAAPAAPTPPSFMDYLANTYSWMWVAQREPAPPANSTILTHV
jgi:hypothetical protein